MRWQIGRRSDNIEDRRGMSVGRGTAVGGEIGTLVLVAPGGVVRRRPERGAAGK